MAKNKGYIIYDANTLHILGTANSVVMASAKVNTYKELYPNADVKYCDKATYDLKKANSKK